jgi:hypothetical protein
MSKIENDASLDLPDFVQSKVVYLPARVAVIVIAVSKVNRQYRDGSV